MKKNLFCYGSKTKAFGALVAVGLVWFLAQEAHSKDKAEVQKDTRISQESLGLRKAPLEDEKKVKLSPYHYSESAPGSSQRIERSYENAPPLIPHDIEGISNITKENNTCLGCHSPDVASTVGATPVPHSHLYDLRKNKPIKNGGVSDARYNCTQCHVPQANAKPLVKNSFKPVFSKKSLEFRSDLMNVMNEGIEDSPKHKEAKSPHKHHHHLEKNNEKK
ncbi:nitrate reductase cytochrome c-type subunit [Helicobacter cetorum]|uniref:nitrate reductase cytochrome c-type subunit n=1 Tax=Helicobacter cetorum TaxID=138563 RepID=UPI000CF05970|nr:nitrate reductase cytochrome c-type subunit [Helicobacter cetorum]